MEMVFVPEGGAHYELLHAEAASPASIAFHR